MLFMSHSHYFKIKMGLGNGTNNFAELMALKLLLCYANERGCKILQIFGDSMIVINWKNKVKKCLNITLVALYEEVQRLTSTFNVITCRHVYRERNNDACRISKEGIIREAGSWKFLEQRETEVYEFYHRPFIEPQPRTGDT